MCVIRGSRWLLSGNRSFRIVMKRSSCVVVAWLLLAAALWLLIWKRQESWHHGSAETSTDPVRPPELKVSIRHGPPPVEPGRVARAQDSADRRDGVMREIQSAVTSYSAEGVRPIAEHLLDPDPELRESARQGLIQLGEPSAIPLLRDAARRLDGAEAAACTEAAAFLELPSWSETEEARAVSAELSKPSPSP